MSERAAKADPAEVEGQLLGRAAEIGRVLAKHGLKELFSRSDDAATPRERARRLRAALEELGPTFCQARADPLDPTRPAPARVHRGAGDAPGPGARRMTEAEVVSVMEEELGVPGRTSSSRSTRARSPPGRSARCTGRRSRTATASSSRCSARRPGPDIYRDLGLLELFAEKAARPARVPPGGRHARGHRASLRLAAAGARLPPGGGEHRADARGARALLAARRARRVHRAVDRAAARHGGGPGRPAARGARGAEPARRRPGSCSSRTTARS